VDARQLPDGSTVRVAGVLTTELGAIDSARIGFVQDPTDGIAVRLDAALPTTIPAGTSITIDGTLGSYFSLRVVNVTAAGLTTGAVATLPEPIGSVTGGVGEALEGIRLSVAGTVTETPGGLADGLGVTIDDGSGPLRLVVATAAQGGQSISTGDQVLAVGPLGQRDSSGTGLSGYRLHATQPGELVVIAAPSPSPPPSPTPTPTGTPLPTATPLPTQPAAPTPTPTAVPTTTPTPAPSAAPTSTPAPSAAPILTIAAARSAAIGARVTVGGVVTAGAGRLGTPALIAIQDSTAGIVVRLADTTPRPTVGTWFELTGTIADPYGQREVRSIADVRPVGQAALPPAVGVDGATLGESVEGMLVSVEGVAQGRPIKATSGDLTFIVTTTRGQVRIVADASAGLSTSSVTTGDRLRLTGVAGQRASRKDAPDGYRVWVRGPADIVRLGSASPSSTPSPSPTSSAGPGASGPIHTIAAAILAGSGTHAIEGTVTTSAGLLDATNRRLIVQDRTAAIEVLIPTGETAPPVGARIRVDGEVGRAYGAPRIRATTIRRLGTAVVSPLELRVAPGAAHEWRLVRLRGDIVEVHRSGDRWTAELLVGGTRIPITGLAGAAIPSAAIEAGRTATVVGIVRRPFPSASDRRFAIVPRTSRDLTIGGAADDRTTAPGAAGSGGPGTGGTGTGSTGGADGQGSGSGSTIGGPPDVDLVALAAHVRETVRVSGLVASVAGDAFRLDDGTAVASVRLRAAAADIAGSILVGDALSATGRVELDPSAGAAILVIDDPAGIALVGDLGVGDPGPGDAPSAGTGPASGSPAAGSAGAATGPATAVAAGLGDPAVPEVGALGLMMIGLASLVVTLLRRRRTRGRLAARIAARLAAIGGARAHGPGVRADAVGGGPSGLATIAMARLPGIPGMPGAAALADHGNDPGAMEDR